MDALRPLWNCVSSSLCSCFNCSEDTGAQAYEPSERTHLLADTVVNSSLVLQRTSSDNLSNEFSQSPKKDDQSALCRLVQNTAMNMIDVGALDSHNLEHQEYNDRIKLYSQRLQQQWNNVQHPGNPPKSILKDVPNPKFYLGKSAKTDDLFQIKRCLNKTKLAMMDIKVDHREAIVVPFRIP